MREVYVISSCRTTVGSFGGSLKDVPTVARELDFDMDKVNGGAIAIGHPIGCSRARIIVTLLHEIAKRPDAKKGLATTLKSAGLSHLQGPRYGLWTDDPSLEMNLTGRDRVSPCQILVQKARLRLSRQPGFSLRSGPLRKGDSLP